MRLFPAFTLFYPVLLELSSALVDLGHGFRCKLKQNNKLAFVVGGCVRDILMGKAPADYDVATSASTEEVKSFFRKTVTIGEKHGTVIVLAGGGQVEVSTFKGDQKLNSQNSSGLEEDLLLRDFTINAMAMDETGRIIDPFEGVMTLKTS